MPSDAAVIVKFPHPMRVAFDLYEQYTFLADMVSECFFSFRRLHSHMNKFESRH